MRASIGGRAVMVGTGACAAVLAVTLAAPASGVTGDPYGTLWNILPPGQSGTITATGLLQVLAGDPNRVAVDGTNAPPNFADQLEMYDALNRRDPASITSADIGTYYKRNDFTPQTVVRSAQPKAGVSV